MERAVVGAEGNRMPSPRVRFAPSPTGHLHVGGARTALFNWLFARHEGGIFVLRIEDTDVVRSERHLEAELLEDLSWLGLQWDEGPDRGGPFGPYRQSERLDIYRSCAERLMAKGKAYPCFCTDEELERKRREHLACGLPPQYDGTCRSLGPSERNRARAEGRPESIRFRVPDDSERRLLDLVRGEVVFPSGMVGDFVIVRSNGLPVYNFAAVVDDDLMEITHVIRGEEHLPNTLRQILLYEALDRPLPRFAHLPLILGRDRSKLSKRHGAASVADFRQRGYPPEAIVNYLAFLGWSSPTGEEILKIEELVRDFSIERVSQSPSIFDENKLDWVAANHIRKGGSKLYFEKALPFFPAILRSTYGEERLREIFDIAAEKLSCFSDLSRETVSFFPGLPNYSDEARSELVNAREFLEAAAEIFDSLENWNSTSIAGAIKELSARTGRKGKALYMPLRAAVTGLCHGPDLLRVMEIRGREDVVSCLRAAEVGGEKRGKEIQ